MFAIQTNKTPLQTGEWEYWTGPNGEPEIFATQEQAQVAIDDWFIEIKEIEDMFPKDDFPEPKNLRVLPYTKETKNAKTVTRS